VLPLPPREPVGQRLRPLDGRAGQHRLALHHPGEGQPGVREREALIRRDRALEPIGGTGIER
jgi:hypothetical protein